MTTLRLALGLIAMVSTAQANPVWADSSVPLPITIGDAPAPNKTTEDRSWHLLQKQHDNLIRSVQHGLTRHECEFARARVMGLPATDEEKEAARVAAEKWKSAQIAESMAREQRCADPQRAKPRNGTYDECDPVWRGVIGPYSGTITQYMMTDIDSAECFQ